MDRYCKYLNGQPNVDSSKIGSGVDVIIRKNEMERKKEKNERKDKKELDRKKKHDKHGRHLKIKGEKKRKDKRKGVEFDANRSSLRYIVFGVAFGVLVTLMAVNSKHKVNKDKK